MRLPAFAIGLAAGMTAAAGVLVLRLMEPTELDWSPFAYVAAASEVLAAAAGTWHLIAERYHKRRAREVLAAATIREQRASAGHAALGLDQGTRRLLDDAYAPDLHDVFEEEK